VADTRDHQAPGGYLPDLEANALAEAMSAFSTPSRLKLLYALLGVERTVEELAASTQLTPNVVSQQLRVLRLLRLGAGRRDGRYIRYRLFDDHVAVGAGARVIEPTWISCFASQTGVPMTPTRPPGGSSAGRRLAQGYRPSISMT